jgi:hypothetical protein
LIGKHLIPHRPERHSVKPNRSEGNNVALNNREQVGIVCVPSPIPTQRKVKEEMTTNQRRMFTIGAVTGGLLTAALLPMAVAFADNFDFTPDITTFAPTQVEGYPPLINEVTGAEQWKFFDLNSNTSLPVNIDGTDTETTIGSFTNDDFLKVASLTVTTSSGTIELPAGSEIDLANFGLGFGNEWLDIPSGPDAGISDLLITPFGDFTLFGSGFAELSAALTF